MAFCRTKQGTLRLVHEGSEYLLDGNGLELPDDLAASIAPHVNVTVDEPAPTPSPTPPPGPAPSGRKMAEKPSE